MIASLKPFAPKLIRSRLKVVTIVTTPKSAGVSSLARITVPPICRTSDTPAADIVAAAPRTARRRNSLPSETGRKAPLASNGIMFYRVEPPTTGPPGAPLLPYIPPPTLACPRVQQALTAQAVRGSRFSSRVEGNGWHANRTQSAARRTTNKLLHPRFAKTTNANSYVGYRVE